MYKRITLRAGQNLNIPVTLMGSPSSVKWYKDGIMMHGQPNVRIDTDNISTRLGIRKVTLDDDGEYKLAAKNEWGATDATFDVRVIG